MQSSDKIIGDNYDFILGAVNKRFFVPLPMRYGIDASDLLAMAYIRYTKYVGGTDQTDITSFLKLFLKICNSTFIDHIRSFTRMKRADKIEVATSFPKDTIAQLEQYDEELNSRLELVVMKACIEFGLSKKLIGTTDYTIIKTVEKEVLSCLKSTNTLNTIE